MAKLSNRTNPRVAVAQASVLDIAGWQDGKSYSSSVAIAGPRKLEVRGCVLRILCGGETWTKIGDVTLADANN